MTESDGNFNLEWKDTSSKPVLKRVNLPSVVHPVLEEIHHDKKLLDIVSDLVRFCVFNERISSRLINLSNVLKITRHGLNTLEL